MISSEFPPGSGGIGSHAYNLAIQTYIHGTNIYVMTISNPEDMALISKFDRKSPFTILRFARYEYRLFSQIKRIITLRYTLRTREIDLVILTGRYSLLLSPLLKIFKPGIKLLAIAHGKDVNPNNLFILLWTKWALNLQSEIIPVSNYTGNYVKKLINSKNKIKVINNGFDTDRFNLSCSKWYIRKNEVKLITIGSVWDRKGQHNVIKVLPDLKMFFGNVDYYIIGRILDTAKLYNEIKKYNMESNVHILGELNDELMLPFLTHSDIFIMLSENQISGDFEGFGIAILEANFLGLPAIGSKNCGIEDAILSEKTGFLVNNQSKEEVIDAVVKIRNNYQFYSNEALKWAQANTWTKVGTRYTTEIDSLC
jgi:phosphatidylinositol alpha-1,6-mannosyltransferase